MIWHKIYEGKTRAYNNCAAPVYSFLASCLGEYDEEDGTGTIVHPLCHLALSHEWLP